MVLYYTIRILLYFITCFVFDQLILNVIYRLFPVFPLLSSRFGSCAKEKEAKSVSDLVGLL